AASPEIVAGLMKSCGLAEDGHYAAFILRPWTGFDEKVPVLTAAAEYVYNTYGLTPVFFAIEPRLDVGAAKKVIAQLTVPHHFLPNAYPAEQTIGLLSHMQMSISMRLHGLIFSAGQGVPLVGVVYDPKVSSFLSYIGQDLYVNLSNLTETSIKTLIDSAFVRGKNPSFLAESVAKLRAAEGVNSQTAADFLSLS
ncbi:MAG: polysaccharide pyruvyl transferase family protein, partial [Evtepia sp.]